MRAVLGTVSFLVITAGTLALAAGFYARSDFPSAFSDGLSCQFTEICEGGNCAPAQNAPFRIDAGPTEQTIRVEAGDEGVVARLSRRNQDVLIPLTGMGGSIIDLVIDRDLSFTYALDVPGTGPEPETTATGVCQVENAE